MLGNEEAVVHHRAKGRTNMRQGAREPTPSQSGHVGNAANRLQTAQYICCRFRKKRIGIKEIRSAEHVEHGLLRPGYVLRRPDPDLGQLARLQTLPRCMEASCMLSPHSLSGQPCEWRVSTRLDSGKNASIVVGAAVGSRNGQNRADEMAKNEGSQKDQL